MTLPEHPIQGLMKTAMENIKGMVDVNAIVGAPVETPDGSVIMPISKVGIGFAAGGSDFTTQNSSEQNKATQANEANQANQGQATSQSADSHPFGGGSGGGLSITPVAFLVVGQHGVNLLSMDRGSHMVERIIDAAPVVIDKLQSLMQGQTGTNQMNNNMQASVPPSDIQ